MSEEIEPHIFKKFEILQKLGKGAYGIVWKAVDKKSRRVVALKKVFEAFHNATDAQRTFREVMILQELTNHDNVIKLLNVIKADNKRDLYLVFEYMETDLHAVIKAGILQREHKQYITYQLLKGLKYIHSGEIIHRDLKPPNMLVNSECLIKIADFGLARSIVSAEDETDPIMTEYVATRWYRAPEIVLGSNKYTKSVDVWSVGCILAELINEKPLFPGKSTFNQIEMIMEVIGKPSAEDVEAIQSENAQSILGSIATKRKSLFSSFFRDANPVVVDFLRRCLEFNPHKRMTIDEALNHEYVRPFREEKEELTLDRAVVIKINDNVKLTTREYREALYQDIIQKKKDQRKAWRQNYLKQLGIPVGGESVKKDLLKQLMNKKREIKESAQPLPDNARPPGPATRESRLLQNSRSSEVLKYNGREAGEAKLTASAKKDPAGDSRPKEAVLSNENVQAQEKPPASQSFAEKSFKKGAVERTGPSVDPKATGTGTREKPLSVSKIASVFGARTVNTVARELLSKPMSSVYDFAKGKPATREPRLSPVPQGTTASSGASGATWQKPQSFQKLSSYYNSLLNNAPKRKD